MPALTTIHDMNYLFWTLHAIGNDKSGKVNLSTLVSLLDKKVTGFQTKYRLQTTRFTSVKQTILNNVLRELRDLGYVTLDEEDVTITDKGRLLYERLKSEKDRRPIVEIVTPDILDVFNEVFLFLDYFLSKSNSFYIPEPMSTSDYHLDVNSLTDRMHAQISACNTFFKDEVVPLDRNFLLDRVSYWKRKSTSNNKAEILRTIYEDYCITNAFGTNLGNVKFKVIRDRLTYLGIINWSQKLYKLPITKVYSILDDEPSNTRGTICIKKRDKIINIPYPGSKYIKEFMKTVKSGFAKLSLTSVGHVFIPDLRDNCCHELRISDFHFDKFLKSVFKNMKAGKAGRLEIFTDFRSDRNFSVKRKGIQFPNTNQIWSEISIKKIA